MLCARNLLFWMFMNKKILILIINTLILFKGKKLKRTKEGNLKDKKGLIKDYKRNNIKLCNKRKFTLNNLIKNNPKRKKKFNNFSLNRIKILFKNFNKSSNIFQKAIKKNTRNQD